MQPRKQGGIGPDLKLPLIADRNMNISRDYGVLLEDEGIALRGLFLIDPKGVLRYDSSKWIVILYQLCFQIIKGKSPSMISLSVVQSMRPFV